MRKLRRGRERGRESTERGREGRGRSDGVILTIGSSYCTNLLDKKPQSGAFQLYSAANSNVVTGQQDSHRHDLLRSSSVPSRPLDRGRGLVRQGVLGPTAASGRTKTRRQGQSPCGEGRLRSAPWPSSWPRRAARPSSRPHPRTTYAP